MAYSLDRKVPDISEIRALAVKYSKDQLRRLARMNLVDPGDAVMAGMMIDRIRAQNMQPPLQTVADDALGINAKPEVMPQQAMPQQAGVTALPSGLPAEMAGGGIVAFADGGDIYDYADGGIVGYAKGNLINAADTVRRSGMSPEQLAQMFASTGPGAPAAPAAPPETPSGMQSLTLPKEAGMGNIRLKDFPTRPEPSLKSEFDLLREAQQQAGLDDAAMFREMREEEKARREELKGRKDQAFGNALIMAGFGLLGARKGEEYEVLSTVGRQGVMQYGAALKDIRETENDIRKAERQLTLAENQLKRDQSAKAQDRYEAKLKEMKETEIKSYEQYNKTLIDLTKLNMDVWKVSEEKAYRMAIAQLEANVRLKTAEIGAYAPSEAERAMAKADALRKAGKEEEAKAYEDRYRSFKGMDVRSGLVTDKELQDTYEKRLEALYGDKKKAFLAEFPTWREFAARERGQSSAGAGAASSANRPSLSSFDKP